MSQEAAQTQAVTLESGEIGLFLKSKNINSKPLGIDKSNFEMLEIEAKDLVKACEVLKNEKDFNSLMIITSLETKNFFQSIYSLEALSSKKQIRIKVNLPKENPIIPSVSHIWKIADWYEREAYDMMGIVYSGHPNLKRILNPDNWEGFPLRKDYIPPSDALNGPHPLTETEYAEKTLEH